MVIRKLWKKLLNLDNAQCMKKIQYNTKVALLVRQPQKQYSSIVKTNVPNLPEIENHDKK